MNEYRYFGGDGSMIVAVEDGVTKFVPADPANSDFARIMAAVSAGDVTIAAFVPSPE